MVNIKRIMLIISGLLSLSFIFAKNDFNVNISISEVKTIDNISTILVKVENISKSKKIIVQPRDQQDSVSLYFPWRFEITQNNVEFSSRTVRLVYGRSGKVHKIKENEIISFKIDILWNYMIDKSYKPISRDKSINVTLFYQLFNKEFRSNSLNIKLNSLQFGYSQFAVV